MERQGENEKRTPISYIDTIFIMTMYRNDYKISLRIFLVFRIIELRNFRKCRSLTIIST